MSVTFVTKMKSAPAVTRVMRQVASPRWSCPVTSLESQMICLAVKGSGVLCNVFPDTGLWDVWGSACRESRETSSFSQAAKHRFQ